MDVGLFEPAHSHCRGHSHVSAWLRPVADGSIRQGMRERSASVHGEPFAILNEKASILGLKQIPDLL
jgi:hypothetical protein